jgi:hypothetical protein
MREGDDAKAVRVHVHRAAPAPVIVLLEVANFLVSAEHLANKFAGRAAEANAGAAGPGGDAMTPTRFRECLEVLDLSQRGLAPLLACSDRLPRAWATGAEPIPPVIAEWLEAWAAVRLQQLRAFPEPQPPKDWRRRRDTAAAAD